MAERSQVMLPERLPEHPPACILNCMEPGLAPLFLVMTVSLGDAQHDPSATHPSQGLVCMASYGLLCILLLLSCWQLCRLQQLHPLQARVENLPRRGTASRMSTWQPSMSCGSTLQLTQAMAGESSCTHL